uniref:Olfactory receptor n=1 Tax=Pelodiscus sinensis TaxID=13735 RepID=K7EWF9_PELSI
PMMEKVEGRNQTIITEFILLGFGEGPELQPLLFFVFFVIYFVTLTGNLFIIALVVADQHLHTPMYFFLWNLAFLETSYTCTILPRLLASLLTGDRAISVKGCLVQFYFFGILATIEIIILTAMSYDRYLAIYHPLRYTALMNVRVCSQLVAGSWMVSIVTCTIVDSFMFQLTFCNSREIDHFFCDFTSMLPLSCSDTQTVQLLALIAAVIWTVVPFLLTLASYVCIISAILKIPSNGRQKAFSTCSSHLMVVTLHYGISFAVYVVPIVSAPKVSQKVFSVFCTVLTPMINPIIYCLRNKEVNESLRKAVCKLVAVRHR